MVRGDLGVFPFLSVMQMLLTSGRAGRLTLEHPRGGQLWIERAEVIHAQRGAMSGEHALELLSSVDGGTFTFEPDLAPPVQTLGLRRDAALHRMLADSEAWTELLRAYPDWSRGLRFTPRWSDAQPVTRGQYRALRVIRSGGPLSEMLERSGQSPRLVLDTLLPFMQAGLIELA